MNNQGQNKQNNTVDVGDNNSGNIAAGDINITQNIIKSKNKLSPFKVTRKTKLRIMLSLKDKKWYKKPIHYKLTAYAKKNYKTGIFKDLSDDEFNDTWQLFKIYITSYCFFPLITLTIILIVLIIL